MQGAQQQQRAGDRMAGPGCSPPGPGAAAAASGVEEEPGGGSLLQAAVPEPGTRVGHADGAGSVWACPAVEAVHTVHSRAPREDTRPKDTAGGTVVVVVVVVAVVGTEKGRDRCCRTGGTETGRTHTGSAGLSVGPSSSNDGQREPRVRRASICAVLTPETLADPQEKKRSIVISENHDGSTPRPHLR